MQASQARAFPARPSEAALPFHVRVSPQRRAVVPGGAEGGGGTGGAEVAGGKRAAEPPSRQPSGFVLKDTADEGDDEGESLTLADSVLCESLLFGDDASSASPASPTQRDPPALAVALASAASSAGASTPAKPPLCSRVSAKAAAGEAALLVEVRHPTADGGPSGAPWLVGRVGSVAVSLEADPDALRLAIEQAALAAAGSSVTLAHMQVGVGGLATVQSALRVHTVTRDGMRLGGHTERVRGALQGLLEDPERVRALLLPQQSTQAARRKARARNEFGKQCADGVAFLRFAKRLSSNEQLSLGVSLDAKLTASGSDASRDLLVDLGLTPATDHAATSGALLTTSLEATPLLLELQLLTEALEAHRMHDAVHLPSGRASAAHLFSSD